MKIRDIPAAKGEDLDRLVESAFGIRRRVETDAELRERAMASVMLSSRNSRSYLENQIRDHLERVMIAGVHVEAVETDLALGWLLRDRPRGFFRRMFWAIGLGLFFFRSSARAGILQHAARRNPPR